MQPQPLKRLRACDKSSEKTCCFLAVKWLGCSSTGVDGQGRSLRLSDVVSRTGLQPKSNPTPSWKLEKVAAKFWSSELFSARQEKSRNEVFKHEYLLEHLCPASKPDP